MASGERERLGCPRGIQFGCERVFVLFASLDEPQATAVLLRVPLPGSAISCRAAGRVKPKVGAFPEGAPAYNRKAVLLEGIFVATAARLRTLLLTRGSDDVNTNDVNGSKRSIAKVARSLIAELAYPPPALIRSVWSRPPASLPRGYTC